MNKTAIVILNYNGQTYLEKFLPSVIANSPGCKIIVADNCSIDNSIDYIESNHPQVEIIQLTQNRGYSEGYNRALEKVNAKYYVLLNSDVEVTPQWTESIIEMMDSDASIAAAQPKILSYHDKSLFEYAGAGGGYLDALGYPFCRGRLFLTLEKDSGQYDDIKQIFWATGACYFVRADLFKKLGGFDPDFFAHMEEIDLCWRMNNTGYKVMYHGRSTVYHVGGGTLNKSNPKKTYLNFRNGLSLLYKNCHKGELWYKFPIRILLDIVASVKFMLFDSFHDGTAVIKAHRDFICDYKTNRQKRIATSKPKKKAYKKLIFSGSIVFEYFIKGKKYFRQLNF